MFACCSTLLLAWEELASPTTSAQAQTDLYDCDNFISQAGVQLLPADPYGLDTDNDGFPAGICYEGLKYERGGVR